MVDNVSSASNAAAPAAPEPSQTASSKKLYHTPFGDVMVDELATPNLLDAFRNYSPAVTTSNAAPAPGTTQNSAASSTGVNEPPPPPDTPTLESEFGQAFLDNPTVTCPDGSIYKYNQIYFATPEAAAKVAAMVGGKVVQQNDMITGGPFKQSDPNQMIQFSDGRQVNAGLIANFFNHGYPKSYIDSLLQKETDGTAI